MEDAFEGTATLEPPPAEEQPVDEQRLALLAEELREAIRRKLPTAE